MPIEMELDTLKQIETKKAIVRIEDLSKDINAPLNQIFNSCIELGDGIDTSTLNKLEKIGITKTINVIYDSCESIRSTRQTIYDVANSNIKR